MPETLGCALDNVGPFDEVCTPGISEGEELGAFDNDGAPEITADELLACVALFKNACVVEIATVLLNSVLASYLPSSSSPSTKASKKSTTSCSVGASSSTGFTSQ